MSKVKTIIKRNIVIFLLLGLIFLIGAIPAPPPSPGGLGEVQNEEFLEEETLEDEEFLEEEKLEDEEFLKEET